ncbi:hypothetical protein [Candidatus Magnetaquiglobus chichijimensis]|uniref:hypothetical protein n=1 Tax=Candidatus Magnetaquiglobus chichijimensis TaxID=3141448 RepID=UPI003B97797A
MLDELRPGGAEIAHVRLLHVLAESLPVLGKLVFSQVYSPVRIALAGHFGRFGMDLDQAQTAHNLFADSPGLKEENPKTQQKTADYHERQNQMASKAGKKGGNGNHRVSILGVLDVFLLI